MAANPPAGPRIAVAEPSVKSLLLELRFNGTVLGTGTGFVMISPRGPVLLTNRHVVTGRHQESNQPLSRTGGVPNEIFVVHNRANRLGEWLQKVEPPYQGDTPRWIEHPVLGPRADFVALPLTSLQDVQLYPYVVGGAEPQIAAGPAEVVSVVGFPFGISAGGALAVWATGFVASEPDIDFQGLPVFLVDCRSRPGQSGSAVIAYRTGAAVTTEGLMLGGGPMMRFLGIYSGRINPESDLGYVWKAVAVNDLVRSIR